TACNRLAALPSPDLPPSKWCMASPTKERTHHERTERGGDHDRLYLISHSSASHLAGCEPHGANVRYWPKADIPSCTAHVRFWGGNATAPPHWLFNTQCVRDGNKPAAWFAFTASFSFIPRAVGHTSKLRLTLQGRDRLRRPHWPACNRKHGAACAGGFDELYLVCATPPEVIRRRY